MPILAGGDEEIDYPSASELDILIALVDGINIDNLYTINDHLTIMSDNLDEADMHYVTCALVSKLLFLGRDALARQVMVIRSAVKPRPSGRGYKARTA